MSLEGHTRIRVQDCSGCSLTSLDYSENRLTPTVYNPGERTSTSSVTGIILYLTYGQYTVRAAIKDLDFKLIVRKVVGDRRPGRASPVGSEKAKRALERPVYTVFCRYHSTVYDPSEGDRRVDVRSYADEMNGKAVTLGLGAPGMIVRIVGKLREVTFDIVDTFSRG